MTQKENRADFANNTTEKLQNDVKCAIMKLTEEQQIELWKELTKIGIIKL